MLWFVIPGVLLGFFLAFLALPVVISARATQDGAEGPVSLRADVAAFWGALGLIARQHGDLWQIGPRLFGRAVGLWFSVGSPPTETPATTPSAPAVKDLAKDHAEADAVEAVEETEDEAPTLPLRQRLHRQWSLICPLVRPVWRLIRSAPRSLSLRRLQVEGRIGLDDPAATGQLQGALYALQRALPRRVRLNVAADFVTPGPRGWVSVTAHLYLGLLLLYIVRTAILGGVGWLYARHSLWRLERRGSAEPVTGI